MRSPDADSKILRSLSAGCRFAYGRANFLRGWTREDRMPAKIRLHATFATLVFPALILILGIVALVALSGAEAAGQGQPQCGDTITTHTTLHHDLIDCPNNGIVIGADGITLNLNGHTIDGDGGLTADCPEDVICDDGIVNDGHDGVTVAHGAVRQFALGALVAGSRHNRVLNITASDNRFPGIVIGDSARSSVRNSSVVRNGLHTDEAGIVLFHSRHSRILNNSIRRNGDIGLFMSRSDHNQIRDNRLRHHPEAGINVEGGDRNRIGHNLLTGDGDGIIVGGNQNAITRNRVFHSRAGPQSGGNGIHAAAGHDNLIARNVIARAATGIRISLRRRELEGGPGAANTVIRRNRVRRANDDGLLVMSTAKHTLLRRNRARHSRDDGIDTHSRSTKLTSNRAVRNGDLGISAVRGVNDGGGNIARHNGDPRQCTHIVCN
jgi:parallel beta-helix repeat protein